MLKKSRGFPDGGEESKRHWTGSRALDPCASPVERKPVLADSWTECASRTVGSQHPWMMVETEEGSAVGEKNSGVVERRIAVGDDHGREEGSEFEAVTSRT